jgi:hypothetical protein
LTLGSRHRRLIVVALLVAASLYGVSYPQFRHFDLEDPRGFSDARNYVEMSHGNYQVSIKHRHRFLIPLAAGGVQELLEPFIADRDLLDRLSFYAVNFLIVWLTGLLVFLILEGLGFSWALSLVGISAFVTSRFTIASAALPVVDSAYFLAIAAIVYLTLERRVLLLACLMPLLALSKETLFPFLLLPFLEKEMRRPPLALSLLASMGIVAFARHRVLAISGGATGNIGDNSFPEVVMERLVALPANLAHLFSPAGLHDLQGGFSFFLVFALLGYAVNRRTPRYTIPLFVQLTALIAAGFAILNGNLGIMLYAAFVPVIVYALVFVEYFMTAGEKGMPTAEEDRN